MRRNKFQLYIEILELTQGTPSKTDIVYKTNMNFKIAQNHLDFLLSKGFIYMENNRYRLTVTGNILLQKLKSVAEELKSL
jgi:predicted transcriptional regulator